MRDEDLTTKARLRDAAITLVAEQGTARLTARRVAEAAGVSPGLVTHHFGSMEGLQVACDEHVAAMVREQEQHALATGMGLDPLASVRGSDFGRLVGYLARRLTDESSTVAKLVDDLVSDAEAYLKQAEEAGVLRPTDDPRGRAVVSTIYSLGALVLHQHVERLLGVDLTDPNVADSPALANYARPAYELFGRGVFTDQAYQQIRAGMAPKT